MGKGKRSKKKPPNVADDGILTIFVAISQQAPGCRTHDNVISMPLHGLRFLGGAPPRRQCDQLPGAAA
jgi:hypothetical protein